MFTSHDDPTLMALDAVFLAVPHTAAWGWRPASWAHGVSVFDLSADYRLASAEVYEEWYGVPHASPELLAGRAFGLPELFAKDLADARASLETGEPAWWHARGAIPRPRRWRLLRRCAWAGAARIRLWWWMPSLA